MSDCARAADASRHVTASSHSPRCLSIRRLWRNRPYPGNKM